MTLFDLQLEMSLKHGEFVKITSPHEKAAVYKIVPEEHDALDHHAWKDIINTHDVHESKKVLHNQPMIKQETPGHDEFKIDIRAKGRNHHY